VEIAVLEDLLGSARLPVNIPPYMSPSSFLALMARDKKVIDGRLRLVLLRTIGEACVVDDVTTDELELLLQAAARRTQTAR
ncbi:MAG TPA: hypothetical protein VIC02_02130, partial [Kineobactrum sp.]